MANLNGIGSSTSSMSFKEDFVESMANLNGVGSFHEFHEFQRRFRWKYGQRELRDDHQPLSESKERLRSSEIKEDGLRFVLRVSEELYLNIYWILNIIWVYNIYIFFRASNAY